MKRVGLLVGREKTFPAALIEQVNERGGGEVVAEMITIGGVRHTYERRYDLIVDRISHEIPYYRAYLKRAALEGTTIINNPFWWSADDKFFGFSLAEKLGVAIPRTVLLPQKDYIPGVVSDSLRNLEFPLDWEAIVEWVGFPAFLKPFDGGGWKNVSKIRSLEELWRVYDQTGTLCMTLQQGIEFDKFVRCYCIGQEEVMIMPYDPNKPYLSGEQYLHDPNYLSAELAERIGNDMRKICRALGYDINTGEFAIKDDIPYAIDFTNPAPDADVHSVGEFYHRWVTDAVTNLIFRRLEEPQPAPLYRWDAMLNPAAGSPAQALGAVASAAGQAARNIIPESVREASADIVAGVQDLMSEAAEAVSGIVNPGDETEAPKAKSSTKRTAASTTGATTKRKPATKKSTSARDAKPDTGA